MREETIDMRTKLRPDAPLHRDECSFARAKAVARAIVTEHHDRPSLISEIACELAAEIIEELRRAGEDLNRSNCRGGSLQPDANPRSLGAAREGKSRSYSATAATSRDVARD
jgi:hypothetical protein